MIIGCHVSMSSPSYLEGSVQEALSYNANALMIYTGAPQNTKRMPVAELHIAQARTLMEKHGISMENMIVHAPYLINLANSIDPATSTLALTLLDLEISRTAAIGAKYLVLHPGCYTSTDLSSGIASISRQLNHLKEIPKSVCICLETMAGKGTEIGSNFEQLAEILDGVEHREHYGICMDTCHMHDAGYDLSDFEGILEKFNHILGINQLKVLHLNDSKNIPGSHKDRHANIGKGKIGLKVLQHIAHHPLIETSIPIILETPYIDGHAPYLEEIQLIRENKTA